MRVSRVGWWSRVALLLGIGGALMLALAGPGYRAGWLSLGTALQRMLTWAAYAGIAAVAVGGVAAILSARRRSGPGLGVALLAVLLGAVSAGIPWRWQQAARQVPAIHDITTDTVTPPEFVEAAALRRELGVPNGLEYTEGVAVRQREGYPDISPVFLDASPAEAYRRALDLVRARGWEVLAADEAGSRIEATDTTRWFGFKDDIAIRVTAMPDGGSRVDVRSVSRVGRSDVGTNARRIRRFLSDLGTA